MGLRWWVGSEKRVRTRNFEMTIPQLLDRVQIAIGGLIRLGFESDANRIGARPDSSALERLLILLPPQISVELLSLYQACDGISLGDVNNGLFVHTIAQLARADHNMMPRSIATPEQKSIFVFGSDGGGSLFAIQLD